MSAGDTAAARVLLLDVWWGAWIAFVFLIDLALRQGIVLPAVQLKTTALRAVVNVVAALAAARVVIEVDRAQRLWLERVPQPVPLPSGEERPVSTAMRETVVSTASGDGVAAESASPPPPAAAPAPPPTAVRTPPSTEPRLPLASPVAGTAPSTAPPVPPQPVPPVSALPVPWSAAAHGPEVRLPCPHCLEPARVDAELCPRCRQSLRVDVSLAGPPADRRFLQFAAQSISQRLPRYAADAVKRGLEKGRLLLTGLTRADAQHVLSALKAAGITATMAPASRRRSVSAPLARWGTAAAAVLVVGGPIAYQTLRSPLSAVEIGALASASTASLRCADSMGSGFFVTTARLVTNAHVVCDAGPIKVSLADGREFEGRTLALDFLHDLAVVAVDGAAVKPLPLGDASRMRRGDEVYFFGSPQGLEFTLSKAIVSHEARNARGIPYLQLDGSVNHGNSGGPVIDQSGHVVGIVTLKVEGAEGLGFAVPVNFLYSGFEEQTLPAGSGLNDDAWRRRLADAKERDDKTFAELVPKLANGMLHSVVLNQRGELTAFQLGMRRHPSYDRRAWLAVDLVRGERLVCRAEGFGEWHPLEEVSVKWVDRETRAWLQSHDPDLKLQGAVVQLHADPCTIPDLVGVAAYVRGSREMPVPLTFADDE